MTDKAVVVPTAATHKFAVILNKTIDPGVVLNACGHMSACIAGRATDEQRACMGFVDYLDADNNPHPVSALSLIVLSAKNGNQIRTARSQAIDAKLLYVDFTSSMVTDTYVEQMVRTAQIPEAGLEYWGLALFGLKTEVDPITKKFSLWRG
jgi:hypothetical protein